MGSVSDRVVDAITPHVTKRGKAAFARKVGISPQALEHYLKRKGVPSAETMARIAKETGQSLAWLTTGEEELAREVRERHWQGPREPELVEKSREQLKKAVGDFFDSVLSLRADRLGISPDELRRRLEGLQTVLPEEAAGEAAGKTGSKRAGGGIDITRQVSEKLRANHPGDFASIPLLCDKAAAGEPAVVDERDIEDYVLMYKDWVPHPDKTRCLCVKGNSMHPVLPEGSIVAVDGMLRDPAALNRAIVAALVDDGVVIKWLRATERGAVLVSENREFEPIVLSSGEDDRNPIIGKVIWSLARWITPQDLAD